jgi:hypothetical protein
MLLRDNVNVTWIIIWGRTQEEKSYVNAANSNRLLASKFNSYLLCPEKKKYSVVVEVPCIMHGNDVLNCKAEVLEIDSFSSAYSHISGHAWRRGWGTMLQAGISRIRDPIKLMFFNVSNPSSRTRPWGLLRV